MRGTIKSSLEISDLFTHGKRYNCSGVTFIVSPMCQHDQSGRVAFIAGKKNGNAVWRNSAKRRMRALCRDLQGPWNGYDVILLAKRNVLKMEYDQLKTAGEKVVAGFLKEPCQESTEG